MRKTHLLSALLVAAAAALHAPLRAETGLHPQNLGFGLDWVHDEDTAFAIVRQGDVRRVLQVNPSTKEWKWVSRDDFAASGLGRGMAMKSREDGVMTAFSGAPHYTRDGWKTVVEAKGTFGGLDQVVPTQSGYAGFGSANRALFFSADGSEWATAEGGPSFSGGGLLRAHGDRAIVLSGLGMMVSADGGRKWEIVQHEGLQAGGFIELRMFSADSLVLVSQSQVYQSVDGGRKWTGNPTGFTAFRAVIRGFDEVIALTQNTNKLHFTSDGGKTWTEKDGPADPFGGGVLASIGDALYLWPGSRSTDGGATWTPFFPGFLQSSGSGGIFCMDFAGSFGAVGYAGGKIAYTFDRARSFTVLDTLPGRLDVMAIRILKGNRLLAGDRNGQTFISADTGRTWTQKLTSAFTQNAVKFSVSADEKVMVLTRLGQPSGSGDDGAKWDFLPAMGGSLSQTVKPDGTIIGMVGNEVATLFLDKTRQRLDTLPSGQGPVDMHAVTDDLGYIVTLVTGGAGSNRVYRTGDGFKSHALVATLDGIGFGNARLQVIGSDFLVLSAEGKTFHLVSSDGGKTWTRDSLEVHARYGSAYPSVRRVHYFDSKQRIQALTGQALYLDAATGTTLGLAGRTSARAPAFTAAFEAGTGRLLLRGLGEVADIGLHDLSGRRVFQGRASAGGSLDVPSLRPGVYLVKARTRSGAVLRARLLRD